MKRALYHGTSADNLQSILKHGLLCAHGGRLWTASRSALYFWSPDELTKQGECDAEFSNERAKQCAVESAQFALSIAKDCRVLVVKVEIDEADVGIDDSCPNMECSGAVEVSRDVKRGEIKEAWISADLSPIKCYFQAMTLDREFSAVQLSPLEEKIARAIQKAEIYLEDIDDLIDLHPLDLSTRRRLIA